MNRLGLILWRIPLPRVLALISPASIFFFLIVIVGIEWCFVRFVHYDRQFEIMSPAQYLCDVLTREDYAQVADPTQDIVKLSDGSEMHKAPAWQSLAVPKFKSVQNGKYYVLVTTTGTAHLLGRWQADFLPILVIALVGLVACLARARRVPITSAMVTSSG